MTPTYANINAKSAHLFNQHMINQGHFTFYFCFPKTSRRIRNSCLPPKRQGLSALLYINWLIEWHWTLYIQISYIYRSGFYDASSMKPRHQFKSKHRLFNFLVCLYLFLFISCVLLIYISIASHNPANEPDFNERSFRGLYAIIIYWIIIIIIYMSHIC